MGQAKLPCVFIHTLVRICSSANSPHLISGLSGRRPVGEDSVGEFIALASLTPLS